MPTDPRKFAPSSARNRDPILAVLGPRLPARGRVLEIASGSGEHTMHLAGAYSGVTFQPSDPDAENRASIDAWTAHLGLANVEPALHIDATKTFAPVTAVDVVVCINMIHIAPWPAAVGLIRNAAGVLPVGGFLYFYGPYRRNGAHTAPSNAAFDESLRARDPSWGIRDLEAVVELAKNAGFAAPDVVEMPANNLSVIFERA
jgi:SAM-dependent methyltransferase